MPAFAKSLKGENPLLEEIQKVLPTIAANAAQADKDRMVPAENMRLLKEAGFLRAFQPKKYGGLEVSLPEFGECVVQIAKACAGTAWSAGLLATHSHQMAMFSEEAQEEFWADAPLATASSSIAPFGKIEEVEGGVIFNGDMRWSSGSDHAEWGIMGFLRDNPEGGKDYCFAVIPRESYEIEDDWFTTAMRSSGTKTMKIAKDTFVPEHRIEKAKDMMTGQSAGYGLYPDSKIFYTPYRPYFASGFSAVSLGIAERMLEFYSNLVKNRKRAYTGAAVGKEIPGLMRLAESTHQIEAARALLEKTWEETKLFGEMKQYPSDETLAYWRTNQGYATKMCIEAVDRLFEAAGGSCWYEDNEAQRLFRDSHATGSHAYTDYDVCKQILGRSLMGMEPDPAMV